MMALCMVGGAVFVCAAVCGCCGERGLALCVFVAGIAFAAAVASHVTRCAPL